MISKISLGGVRVVAVKFEHWFRTISHLNAKFYLLIGFGVVVAPGTTEKSKKKMQLFFETSSRFQSFT
jgi:hypothetical protein